jgi:hypothetical protein
VEDLVRCLDDLLIVTANSQHALENKANFRLGDCDGPLKRGKADGDFCAVRQREGSASAVSARCGIAKNILALGCRRGRQGLQEEKNGMKIEMATSILYSFPYMNLTGRIPASTLLAVIATAAAWAQSAPAVSSAEARKAIQARVAMDKNTIERMLAPDLYVQTPDRKLTRQEFIDAIFSRPYTLTRFEATVLTVEPRGK